MVHIMEGVVERGTATILRDLNRPMFGKTGTTSGPTNASGSSAASSKGRWRRLPRLRQAAADGPWRAGRACIAARRSSAVRAGCVQGYAEGAVRRASNGIQLGPRRPRHRPPRVRSFPVQEDPKSAVIWEAFQPQTEPRRFYRRSALSVTGAGDQSGRDPDAVADSRSGARACCPGAVRGPSRRTQHGRALQNQATIN